MKFTIEIEIPSEYHAKKFEKDIALIIDDMIRSVIVNEHVKPKFCHVYKEGKPMPIHIEDMAAWKKEFEMYRERLSYEE